MASGGKSIVITGGNSGIGLETAKALAGRGWHVTITGRNRAGLERAAAEIGHGTRFLLGDYASLASVRALAGELASGPRIDVLLNNVGIATTKKRVTGDGNDTVLQVNHLAPFLLTNLLLGKLRSEAPARIVNVASRFHMMATSHGFDDFQMERHFAFRESYYRTKLYNVMFTRELARRTAGIGVTANALHPGGIRTRIGRDGDIGGLFSLVWPLFQRLSFEPIEAGSKVTSHVASAPELDGVSGELFSTGLEPVPPNPLATDDEACRRLWKMSADLVGLDR